MRYRKDIDLNTKTDERAPLTHFSSSSDVWVKYKMELADFWPLGGETIQFKIQYNFGLNYCLFEDVYYS